MSKFRYFGPKSINFLILIKFRGNPISKVLISNLTFSFYGSQQPSIQAAPTNSVFSVLQFILKSAPIAIILKVLMTLKKSKHILSLGVLRF